MVSNLVSLLLLTLGISSSSRIPINDDSDSTEPKGRKRYRDRKENFDPIPHPKWSYHALGASDSMQSYQHPSPEPTRRPTPLPTKLHTLRPTNPLHDKHPITNMPSPEPTNKPSAPPKRHCRYDTDEDIDTDFVILYDNTCQLSVENCDTFLSGINSLISQVLTHNNRVQTMQINPSGHAQILVDFEDDSLQNNPREYVDFVHEFGDCTGGGLGKTELVKALNDAFQAFDTDDKRIDTLIIVSACMDERRDKLCHKIRKHLYDLQIEPYIINVISPSNGINAITSSDADNYLQCVANYDSKRVCVAQDMNKLHSAIDQCLLAQMCMPEMVTNPSPNYLNLRLSQYDSDSQAKAILNSAEGDFPTPEPTPRPSPSPTPIPTPIPSDMPTNEPSRDPTTDPTLFPITDIPTYNPTDMPTYNPTDFPTYNPTGMPTHNPTDIPTYNPTDMPTYNPTDMPTYNPTVPTYNPIDMLTYEPTDMPTYNPTDIPTYEPTDIPTRVPTNIPTPFPTNIPTPFPTNMPIPMTTTDAHTPMPTAKPTPNPTRKPTSMPTPASIWPTKKHTKDSPCDTMTGMDFMIFVDNSCGLNQTDCDNLLKGVGEIIYKLLDYPNTRIATIQFGSGRRDFNVLVDFEDISMQKHAVRYVDYILCNGECERGGVGRTNLYIALKRALNLIDYSRVTKFVVVSACKDTTNKVCKIARNEIETYAINVVLTLDRSARKNDIECPRDATQYLECLTGEGNMCPTDGVMVSEFDHVMEHCLMPQICMPHRLYSDSDD